MGEGYAIPTNKPAGAAGAPFLDEGPMGYEKLPSDASGMFYGISAVAMRLAADLREEPKVWLPVDRRGRRSPHPKV